MIATENQRAVMDQIIAAYKENNQLKCLVYSSGNTGKTVMVKLLATEFGTSEVSVIPRPYNLTDLGEFVERLPHQDPVIFCYGESSGLFPIRDLQDMIDYINQYPKHILIYLSNMHPDQLPLTDLGIELCLEL